MSTYSISFQAQLDATVTACSVGDPLVISSSGGYVISTLANRTALGGRRTSGVARTPGDATNRAVDIQHDGMVPAASLPTLGPGTQSFVIVSSAGVLVRSASPLTSDDVIGIVDTDGNMLLLAGQTLGSGGGGTTSPGGSAGDVQVNVGGTTFGGITPTTTGAVLRATSPTASAFGALDLANSSARTGLLPLTNQAAPTGTGLAGVTGGAWDTASTPFPLAVSKGGTHQSALGSALQVLRTNAGATDTEWATISAGSSVTWANDLGSSTNTNQYVSGISGSNGSGGTVAIVGGVTLQFGSAGGGIINVASVSTTGSSLTVAAGASSGTAGGSLNLNSGAGVSAGVAGNINMSLGPTLALQMTAGSLTAGDIMSTGSGTVMQRFAKGSNFTFWGVNGSGVVGYNPVGTSFITPGTAGQMMTTVAGPVVSWGNSVSSLTTPYVTNSGSDVYFGSDATGAANQAVNCRFYPSSALLLGISNTNYVLCQSSSVVVRQSMFISGAVGGESVLSTPFHWNAATIAMSASVTATAAQYACPFLTCTGATTGNVLILPNTTGAIFWIRNTGSSMVAKVSGQTGVTIGSTARACIICNGTDYESYP